MWFAWPSKTIELDKAQRKFVATHMMNGGNATVASLLFTQVNLESGEMVLAILGIALSFLSLLEKKNYSPKITTYIF